MRTRTLAVFLVFSLVLAAGFKVRSDRITRTSVPGSSFIYIPSGKYLKFASFGYSSLLADLIYLWAIQYFSDTTIPNRFESMDHIFSIIAELDPLFLDAYELGALIAVYDARDLDLAFRILDRGLEKNPDQWIFPMQAGHYAAMTVKDYETARAYYQKAMEVPGAPAIARRLYANAAYRTMDYKTAWESWIEIDRTTEDERIKKIASNHLYQIKSAMDIEALTAAIQKYAGETGSYPDSLEALVRAGLLNSVPRDLDANEYAYNPQTGEVEAPSSPWKR